MSEYRVRRCDWCRRETDQGHTEFGRYANLVLWVSDVQSPSQTRLLPGLPDPSGEMLCPNCQRSLGRAVKECREMATATVAKNL